MIKTKFFLKYHEKKIWIKSSLNRIKDKYQESMEKDCFWILLLWFDWRKNEKYEYSWEITNQKSLFGIFKRNLALKTQFIPS